jgi:hypothetical protein
VVVATANYLILCHELIKDDVGRLSLINIFDTVGGPKLPIVPANFVAAFNFSFDKNDLKNGSINIGLRIDDSEGKSVLEVTGTGKVDPKKNKVSSSIDLSRKALFKSVGIHKISLLISETVVATTDLTVVLGERPRV